MKRNRTQWNWDVTPFLLRRLRHHCRCHQKLLEFELWGPPDQHIQRHTFYNQVSLHLGMKKLHLGPIGFGLYIHILQYICIVVTHLCMILYIFHIYANDV